MTITGWEAVTLAGMTVAGLLALYWHTRRTHRHDSNGENDR